MKRCKFSESQMAFTLRQAEETTSVDEVCRKAGIGQATFYNWKRSTADLCRLRSSGSNSLRKSMVS